MSMNSPLLLWFLLGLAAAQQPRSSGQGAANLRCNIHDPACQAALSHKHGCNILEASCQARINGHTGSNRPTDNFKQGLKKCNYPDLWLIPGKADTSCTQVGASQVLSIDPSNVEIYPKTIKLPGCFTIKISGTALEPSRGVPNSFMGKASYKWWNLREFSELKCQNASNNGCGGYGNNCNYCDICGNLDELHNENRTNDPQMTKSQQELIDQFSGLKCPNGPGDFVISKEFCFNDWKALDEDGDCKFDFLKGEDIGGYKSALQSLNQLGFGTLVATFKLAHNATESQLLKKGSKEAEIDARVRKELHERRANWDVSNGQYETFQSWYIQYRKDNWHRNRYLPWLMYTNEVSCLTVTFDVCDKQPTPVSASWLSGFYNGPSMQCV